MPILTHNGQSASTFNEQADMLRDFFFPPTSSAGLSDLVCCVYPPPKDCPRVITKAEVVRAPSRLKPGKAPGPDGISNRILKACSERLVILATPLFQACLDHGYHSKVFKEANSVALPKVGKADYTIAKAYRPIALKITDSFFCV